MGRTLGRIRNGELHVWRSGELGTSYFTAPGLVVSGSIGLRAAYLENPLGAGNVSSVLVPVEAGNALQLLPCLDLALAVWATHTTPCGVEVTIIGSRVGTNLHL